MNPVTILLGIAAIGYGLYTAWARRAKPEQFKKLEPMKKFWGRRGGQVIYIVGYTVMPIVAGIIFILMGLQGGSLF